LADDIALTAQSTIYFTDAVHKTVGYIDAKRRVHVVYSGGEIALPLGVALSPDQAMLIVSDGQSRFSWSFQIVADGSLMNGEPYYRLEMPEAGWTSGVYGAIEDSDGQVYFATPIGVQFCEANGRVAGILNPPEHGPITDLVFAGKNLDWLYVSENGKLFRRSVKVRGTSVGAPVKPPKPPL
jgi:gluconolactonase